MTILRLAWMGVVLVALLAISSSIPVASSEASPEPGKVVFKSPTSNYEYEVGTEKDKGKNPSLNIDFDKFFNNPEAGGTGHSEDTCECNKEQKLDLTWEPLSTKDIAAANVLRAASSATVTSIKAFTPLYLFPGYTGQNVTKATMTLINNADDWQNDGEESRRISIAIRPVAAASENADVVVKVKNSQKQDDESESNEVEQESSMEKRKRDCRGLPWPFVNALNATNCQDLDDNGFSPRLLASREDEDEDDEDSTIVLPKRRQNRKPARGGNRRVQPREEDYDEDSPYDPFHSPLPQARTYHEWAMMLRDMGPPNPNTPPYLKGPASYQDFHRHYDHPLGYHDHHHHQNDHGWGWGTTTPSPGWGETTTHGWGWGESTTESPNQRQGHELKNSFGQPSQPGNAQNPSASFGQPSNPQIQGKQLTFGLAPEQVQQGTSSTFGQPAPQQGQLGTASFGQPAPTVPHNGTQHGGREAKALEFGQPSVQQVQVPAPPSQQASFGQPPVQQQQQFQQRAGEPSKPVYTAVVSPQPPQNINYLQPAYYGAAPTTPKPYFAGREDQTNESHTETEKPGWGWDTTTTEKSGWGWESSTTTQKPAYKQPHFQQPQYQQQPNPTVYPIYQTGNTSKANSPQQQQQSPQPTPSANVTEMYERLLNLYKLLINDDTTQQQQPAPEERSRPGPPPYQPPNPWQVPSPQQIWSGALSGGRGYEGYYPEEILPGIQDDPYLYDPLDQPKLLPKPISPVGRRSRQFRRRNSRVGRNFDDDDDGPRVKFMNDGPTILHETTNNKEFLPRRRYFKRKIDETELKKTNEKKSTPRRWGSGVEDAEYDNDPYTRRQKHPNVPAWLKYSTYDYQAPIYGPPPPPENSGGWGEPTQPPSKSGWGWGTTTQKPGWGWETTEKPGWGWDTTTTEKSGWGWESSTTTTTTTEQPTAEQSGQQQNSTSTIEEGPGPGQQWNPPPDSKQQYLQNEFLKLQQQLYEQLVAQGKVQPTQPPQQQQPVTQAQPQFPIYQTGQNQFGTQAVGVQQLPPNQYYSPQQSLTPQQIQQQQQQLPGQPQATPGAGQPPGQQDQVIEDIGRNAATLPTPAFRGQQTPAQGDGTRYGTARQLFDGDARQPATASVTSDSLPESLVDEKSGETGSPATAAVEDNPGTPRQVSTNNSTATTQNSSNPAVVYSVAVNSSSLTNPSTSSAVQQLQYSPSSTNEPNRGSPASWGNWGGIQQSQTRRQVNLSPTYSRVQDPTQSNSVYSYNILKKVNDESGSPSFIETLSEAKKINKEENQSGPSLVARVID